MFPALESARVNSLGGFLRDDFTAGERLGRYELVAIIGGGGFASVWLARSIGPGGFERDVAIKVIRQGRASLKRFQDMLLDEARLVARIQHPNVAQIWEVGEDPRSLYFVMELVDGDSLDELNVRAEAAGKHLPIRAIFRVLADACAGLHVAHELKLEEAPLGLVHRDVSPQNILVSRHGTAKLIDFGIAKARERLAPDTTTGYIKGKISFMAPEQARSEDVDRRADIWAMGAVAYELIESKPPFDAATDIGRLAALVGPTPVPAMSDRAPQPLRRVVERSLQKDASLRYATALELKEAIEEALVESELETTPDEVGVLLAPYFHKRRGKHEATLANSDAPKVAVEDAHSVERAVSSTIALAPKSEVIEIPRRRSYWPLAVAGAALVPIVWWVVSGSSSEPASGSPSAGSSGAQAVTATATATTTASVLVTPEPSTPLSARPPQTASASVKVAAPASSGRGAASGKPAAPRLAPSLQTSKPSVPTEPDPNAIE